MNVDPLSLIRQVCVAPAHAAGTSDAALTIRDGGWAFCPAGADASGHEWQPTTGRPPAAARRHATLPPGPGAPPATTAGPREAPDRPATGRATDGGARPAASSRRRPKRRT